MSQDRKVYRRAGLLNLVRSALSGVRGDAKQVYSEFPNPIAEEAETTGATLQLPEEEGWTAFTELKGAATIVVRGKSSSATPHAKGVVIAIEFLTGDIPLSGPYAGIMTSRLFGPYVYLAVGDRAEFERVLPVPAGVESVKLTFHIWKAESVTITDLSIIPLDGVNDVEGEQLDYPVASNTVSIGDGEITNSIEEFSYIRLSEGSQRTVSVAGYELLLVSGLVISAEKSDPKGGLLALSFLGGDEVIEGPYPGIPTSQRAGPYVYLPIADKKQFNRLIPVPRGAKELCVTFRPWVVEEAELGDLTFSSYSISEVLADALAGTDALLCRIVADAARSRGMISATMAARRRAYLLTRSEEDRIRLNSTIGELKELSTDWLPRVYIPRQEKPTDPLKVAHIHKVSLASESSGGAVRNFNLVRSQYEIGMRPFVVTPLVSVSGPEEEEERSLHQVIDGVDHYSLLTNRVAGPTLPRSDLLQYDTLLTAEILSWERPSILHVASGFRGYELALKSLPIARALNIPFIYEVRSFHEHLWGQDATLDCELTRLRMAQENRLIGAADAVVVIAEAMKDALVGRGIDGRKIKVVPNAVGTEFLALPSNIRNKKDVLGIVDKCVIGYISNFSRREGHEVLLGAFARLAHKSAQLHCLLIGDGPTRQRCQALALKLGIADRVTFLGEIPHADIASYYMTIDVFVVPRMADYAADFVTPLKPFEAMALERPLICSDRPVATEVVGRKQERGLLFRTADEEDLAAKIEIVISNREDVARRTKAARKWVLEKRTWRGNAHTYRDIYNSLFQVGD